MATRFFRRALPAIGLALVLLAGCAHRPAAESADSAPTAVPADIHKRARIRLQLAAGYYEQRQYPIALDEVKQALASDPDFADAYSVRALIYMEMGETQKAEDSFAQAMKLAPNNPEISNNFGWFLCQNGRAAESIAYFEASLKNRAYQSPAKALHNAGVCSLKLKDSAAAERYLARAFQFDPGDPAIATSLARVYFGRGDLERARFYVVRALKSERADAATLWLAIRIEHKAGNASSENSLAAQLQRRFPNSVELASYQRGAFDE